MKTHNAGNERIKRTYFRYLREANRQSEASVDAVARSLSRFEAYTRFVDFKVFRIEQAVAFKRHLTQQSSQSTGEPLSAATLYSTLNALKKFFHWLAGQPGFRSHLTFSDSEYFSLPRKESSVATAHRQRPCPTLEQVDHVLRTMPAGTEIEKRDRAVIALAILTGARDSALASFQLKHLDPVEGLLQQDARIVKTKNSKTFTTWYFPVGDFPRQIVSDWVDYLRQKRLWSLDDPLFPATLVGQDESHQFCATGLDRRPWANADPIRKLFKAAFEHAGLPYFHPHSLRKTLALLGEQLCQTPEEFKSWSQNLGHDGVMTTLMSYGTVPPHRQAEILRALGQPRGIVPSDEHRFREIAEQVFRENTPGPTLGRSEQK